MLKEHSWLTTLAHIVGGKGCPYCSGKIPIEGENDLKTLFPEISKEWNWERNGNKGPNEYKVRSNKSVWWRCKKGHEWRTKIVYRTTNGTNVNGKS